MLSLGARAVAGGALFVACGGSTRDLLAKPPGAVSVRRAGTLRIGLPARNGEAVGVPDAVYARLVALDPRNGRMYGDLAEAVELADDGLTLSIRVRGELRFHPDKDGLAGAITSEEIRRDFRTRGEAGEYLFAAAVASVETPDLRTVVLRLRAPFSLTLDYLAAVDSGAIRASARYGAIDAPLGAGPFVPAMREELGVALVANPLYHRRAQPFLERLQLIDGGPPRDLATAVASGDIDVALHAPDTKPETPARGQAPTVRRASRRLRGLGFSLVPRKGATGPAATPAFQDARVRRAAALALDRKALLALDDSTPSGPIGPAHTMDALPQDELAKHPLYQYNPGQARALLAAAGQESLSFTLEGENRPQIRALAQLVEKQLRDVGLVPRVRLLPVADWEQQFQLGEFEGALVEFAEMRTPDLGLRLHTSGGIAGNFSLWGFSSPLYDTAARKAFSEVDPRLRGERARAAQRVLLDEVPALLPIGAPPEYASVAAAVRGYEFDAYEFNAGWLSAQWRLDTARGG
jgi:peptide/nickel transport system substrate-binding protein